jgi:glycosyltransferase involved in cell wall biosynthesis
MRIAQVAPLFEAVPPKLYGGTERVVSFLTEELVELGHHVTLFASGDSQTSAKLEPCWPRAMRLDRSVRDWMAPTMNMLERVHQRADEFDVIHCHLDYFPFSMLSRGDTPFVTTLHGRLDLPELHPIYETFEHVPIVSISDSQRKPMPKAGWHSTVHHGLPVNLLRPLDRERTYLAFLGRTAPEKRLDRAIRIASAAKMQLKVAAKVDPADEDYFAKEIEPMLKISEHVDFIGEISDDQKSEFLSGAKALLLPIDWPEPFGLVMIEAMACGTPVIAYNNGSVPEVIEHGKTGFIVNDEAEAVEALQQLHTLSPTVIRREFEQRFTSRRMAQDYVGIYRSLQPAGASVLPLRAVANAGK